MTRWANLIPNEEAALSDSLIMHTVFLHAGIFNSEVSKDLWAAFPVEVGVDIP